MAKWMHYWVKGNAMFKSENDQTNLLLIVSLDQAQHAQVVELLAYDKRTEGGIKGRYLLGNLMTLKIPMTGK